MAFTLKAFLLKYFPEQYKEIFHLNTREKAVVFTKVSQSHKAMFKAALAISEIQKL